MLRKIKEVFRKKAGGNRCNKKIKKILPIAKEAVKSSERSYPKNHINYFRREKALNQIIDELNNDAAKYTYEDLLEAIEISWEEVKSERTS